MRSLILCLIATLIAANSAHSADAPYVVYRGKVANFERKISEYNSETVSNGFIQQGTIPVSQDSPPTYTLSPGESIALLFKFTKNSSGNFRPQTEDFFQCDKIMRRVDGNPVTFNDMLGFTFEYDMFVDTDQDTLNSRLIGKFNPPLPVEQFNGTHAIWIFSAQDIAAFAADPAFSDDANQVAGKVLEYMCFHDERDPMPFVVLRLDATQVGLGETYDAAGARKRKERESERSKLIDRAFKGRALDKSGG